MKHFEYEYERYVPTSDSEVSVSLHVEKISAPDIVGAIVAVNQDLAENYGAECFEILAFRRVQQ